MSFGQDAIFGIGTTQIIVPAGGTNAVFVDVVPRLGAILIKYFSGGTLEIQQVNQTNGSTMPGASLAGLAGTGYILGTSESVTIEGPARFYLMASGSTGVACLIRGLTNPGFNNFGVS